MSSSIAHLMAFAKDTNFDPMDREGPIKHLEAYMNKTTEDALKPLLGFLKGNLNKMPKDVKEMLKDLLVRSYSLEVESFDPEPTVKAVKGKGKQREVCPCGVMTKSKKPCKKNGLPEFGGKCKQHKDETPTTRVISVETKIVEEPKMFIGESSKVPDEEEFEMSEHDSRILEEMNRMGMDEEDEEYEEIDEIEFDNYDMD